MRKRAGTSQRLRQDQREKGMAAETNTETESTTPAQQSGCQLYTQSIPGPWSVKSRSFCKLKSTVSGSGPREQGRNDEQEGKP